MVIWVGLGFVSFLCFSHPSSMREGREGASMVDLVLREEGRNTSLSLISDSHRSQFDNLSS